MKACLDPLMRQERAIMNALRATTDPRIAGAELELREGGKVLVRLEARQLR
jgi:heat shock protein HslJ